MLFNRAGRKICPVRPAGEYLHSERLWMLEKVSAALKSTPTTIPQTPHISKNPQNRIGTRPFDTYVKICIFRLMLRCFLVARKDNLTGVLTGLTGRSKNLDPTGNPTGRSTQPVPVYLIGFHLCPVHSHYIFSDYAPPL